MEDGDAVPQRRGPAQAGGGGSPPSARRCRWAGSAADPATRPCLLALGQG